MSTLRFRIVNPTTGFVYSRHATRRAAEAQLRWYRNNGKRNTPLEIQDMAPAEPDLAQMFDMAYEDQCRDACGL